MKKLLLIGPTVGSSEQTIGGTTISFGILVDYLKQQNIPHRVISINASPNRWLSALICLGQSIIFIPTCKIVMLNVNPRGAIFIAPLIHLYSKLLARKYVFRMFGGDLIEIYKKQSSVGKWMMDRSVLSADILYLQTRELIEYFKPTANNPQWLPTSRIPTSNVKKRSFTKKFVFVGQVMKSKGVDHVIQLAENRSDLHVAIYGPIFESHYNFLDEKDYYHGVLKPDNVQTKLAEYDILLLPTTHSGEGYPGVIIEAFHSGMPVIATNWLNLPEIVLHDKTGLLIETHSYDALEEAVNSIDAKKYDEMVEHTKHWAVQFDANNVNQRLLSEMNEL